MSGARVEMIRMDEPSVPGQPPSPREFLWQGRARSVASILRRWQDDPSRARG